MQKCEKRVKSSASFSFVEINARDSLSLSPRSIKLHKPNEVKYIPVKNTQLHITASLSLFTIRESHANAESNRG